MSWDSNPLVVVWEVTRRCELVCRHCRASAKRFPLPGELTTEEAMRLIDQVVRIRPRVLIFSGGDPMMREDILDLIRYARKQGLTVALSPSATPRLIGSDWFELRKAGVSRVSLSLDGATRESHDRFRGVEGTWDLTMQAFALARRSKIAVQVNTTLTRENFEEFHEFEPLLERLQPAAWTVFLLVPTGRARAESMPDAMQTEQALMWLADLAQRVPYDIRTTEGPMFRRVAWQRWRARGGTREPHLTPTNDGRGFVFISHTGQICPSGFLPISCGNVRSVDLGEVYLHSKLFQDLRNPDKLRGKCRYCEYRTVCGGSRSRAFAVNGDYFGEDPSCVYRPGGVIVSMAETA